MRRILVTGGAGFIGSNLVRRLRKDLPADRVIVLDRLTYAGNLENLKGLEEGPGYAFVRGDIGDFALVDGLLQRERVDIVVNMAAESHVDRSISGPKAFVETNVNGTFTLLEAARKNWKACEGKKRFIHVSTDEVYGSLGPRGSFAEDAPYRPNSPYAATKAASDHLVRAWGHTYGLPVITTNCSNNYGPYQFPEKLVPLMIINALEGRELPVYGDGENVRDWIFVEDHCDALLAVMERGETGGTYNIGTRNERKNIDIVRLICGIIDGLMGADAGLSKRYPFQGSRSGLIRFVKDRPGHDRRYAIDPSRVERELRWSRPTDFRQGLRATVLWYIENRDWWERVMSGEYRDYYDLQYKERP